MQDDIPFKQIAIIGLGQMGASLGLAIRQAFPEIIITGFDSNPQHASLALQHGAVTHIGASLEQTVKQADLVILATPVGSYASIIRNCIQQIKQSATLSDIGSIKQQAIDDLLPILAARPDIRFVPAHPIAGSEHAGPATARADFFVDHLFLITPLDGTPPEYVQPVAALWHGLGARVDLLPAALHDVIYAAMSHMPQLLAYAAAQVLAANHVQAKAEDNLYQRFIRISRSDATMWRDVFTENAANVLGIAAHVEAILTHMRDEMLLGGGDNQDQPDAATAMLLYKILWPRLLAAALLSATELTEQQVKLRLAVFAAGGFNDVSAPATDSEPSENEFRLISNFPAFFASALTNYLAQQKALTDCIQSGNKDALHALLMSAQAAGKSLVTPRH